jgi:3-deoxy-D-manno-octulosonic acid (KDO) 8-phosphate synthase
MFIPSRKFPPRRRSPMCFKSPPSLSSDGFGGVRRQNRAGGEREKRPIPFPVGRQKYCEKVRAAGSGPVLLTERGASFGYNNLVVDMRSLDVLRGFGAPVVFDATHSVQLPGGKGAASGGQREFIYPLARAAVAVGVAAVFMEVHPDPEKALSDGPNAVRLAHVPELAQTVAEAIDRVVKGRGFLTKQVCVREGP